MEELKTKRMNSTNIKEKSWIQYQRNISRLAKAITGEEYNNNEFLKERKVVEDYIDESSSDAVKRLLYSVILIMLAPDKNDTKAQNTPDYKFYQIKLQELAQKYNDERETQIKTVKQNENWESWADILKLQKTMALEIKKMFLPLIEKTQEKNKKGKMKTILTGKTINRKQRTALQNLLIVSLYTLIKPRRLDYANMNILSIKEYNTMSSEDRQQKNFLVIVGKNKKFFSFGKQAQKNQNRDKHGVKQPVYVLAVPSKLNKILNTYLLFHEGPSLLYNTRDGAISGDGLSKAMIKIMKARFNKNISPTMLRTIYLSDKHKDDVGLEDKQTTAEEMGHTVATSNQNYQKK